ncbi:MFS transporter [Nocardiopsis trehalosi]|uniref:MFS transporter n=1 Tax=Nocardiopsis trehalosi TaxID=109329 RepID=UPI000A06FEF3|nr:MFS transporter [Nocardiopsis trehalosi]
MGVRNRWIILSIAIVAQIASVAALFGVAFVLPELQDTYGLNVAQAGTLAGLPSLGLLLTLLVWGVVIDRWGERFTMALSLVLTAGFLALLGTVDSATGAATVLALVGAAGGPVNAASGRLVLDRFHARERGLAMGIRQAAQPLGVGASAAILPVAAGQWGFAGAMLVPALLAVVTTPLVLLIASPGRTARHPRTVETDGAASGTGPAAGGGEPAHADLRTATAPESTGGADADRPGVDRDVEPEGTASSGRPLGDADPDDTGAPGRAAPARGGSGDTAPVAGGDSGGITAPVRGGSPYRHGAIWRVHAISMLLGVPQFAVMTYALVYLVQEHGWTASAAGAAIAATQVPGALSRLLAGVWSDRVGSRLGPVRVIAAVSGGALLLLAAAPAVLPGAAVPLLLACLVLSMSHNGLTFTAVAETAGLAWAGRAMAAQNSLQAVSTTLTPVLMAGVIHWQGLGAVYGVAAVFCAAAVAAVPRRAPGGTARA